MNQEIKKIFEQYFCGKKYEKIHETNSFDEKMIIYENIFIDKNFFNDYPVYYVYSYVTEPHYYPFMQKLIKTTKNNDLCLAVTDSIFPKQLSDSLKFFDYYEDKKNFIEYENKKILQTIYLILRKKIPFLSIILILSFMRTVHLGNTLYLKKYEEIPGINFYTMRY